MLSSLKKLWQKLWKPHKKFSVIATIKLDISDNSTNPISFDVTWKPGNEGDFAQLLFQMSNGYFFEPIVRYIQDVVPQASQDVIMSTLVNLQQSHDGFTKLMQRNIQDNYDEPLIDPMDVFNVIQKVNKTTVTEE